MAAEFLETFIDLVTLTGMGFVWLYFKDTLKMHYNNARLQKSLLKEEANVLRNLRKGRDDRSEATPAYSPPLKTD